MKPDQHKLSKNERKGKKRLRSKQPIGALCNNNILQSNIHVIGLAEREEKKWDQKVVECERLIK